MPCHEKLMRKAKKNFLDFTMWATFTTKPERSIQAFVARLNGLQVAMI
jgi:hypothetical protein